MRSTPSLFRRSSDLAAITSRPATTQSPGGDLQFSPASCADPVELSTTVAWNFNNIGPMQPNTGRNSFRGAGVSMLNASLFRGFHKYRKTEFQIRFEAINNAWVSIGERRARNRISIGIGITGTGPGTTRFSAQLTDHAHLVSEWGFGGALSSGNLSRCRMPKPSAFPDTRTPVVQRGSATAPVGSLRLASCDPGEPCTVAPDE